MDSELAKSDIFSLGLIAFYCIDTLEFGKNLGKTLIEFKTSMNKEEVESYLIKFEKELLAYLDGFSNRNIKNPKIINLFFMLKSMLSFLPDARPSIQQLSEDFPEIINKEVTEPFIIEEILDFIDTDVFSFGRLILFSLDKNEFVSQEKHFYKDKKRLQEYLDQFREKNKNKNIFYMLKCIFNSSELDQDNLKRLLKNVYHTGSNLVKIKKYEISSENKFFHREGNAYSNLMNTLDDSLVHLMDIINFFFDEVRIGETLKKDWKNSLNIRLEVEKKFYDWTQKFDIDENKKLHMSINYLLRSFKILFNPSLNEPGIKESLIEILKERIDNIFENLSLIFALRLHRPAVHILQVFDLMLHNRTDKDLVTAETLKTYVSTVVLKKQRQLRNPDWRILRKLEFKDKTSKALDKKIEKSFRCKLNLIKKRISLNLHISTTLKCAYVLINILDEKLKEDSESFLNCLKKGRFDKEFFAEKLDCQNMRVNNMSIKKATLILGNEGQLFWLLNSIQSKSLEETILFEFGIKPDYLDSIRKKYKKEVLGSGAFGKVRFVLCLFGNSMTDFCRLRCVKKYREKNLTYQIEDIAYEDFFMNEIEGSVIIAKPLDIAIIKDTKQEVTMKPYLFMELFPYMTAYRVV